MTYALQRIGLTALLLLAAAVAIFLMLNALPGDPAAVMLGLNAPAEATANLRRDMGLDRSLMSQFGAWAFGMLQGNFGTSFAYKLPVLTLIAERLPVTLPLAALSLAFVCVAGVVMAMVAALSAGNLTDAVLRGLSLILLCIPSFFMGLLLILAFSVHARLLPSGGFPGWDNDKLQALNALVLPSLALGLAQSAVLFRVARASLLDVLSEPYLRTARMKGLARFQAVLRHALPNAAPAVLTMIGFQASFLVTGSIIIENVFALPGLGRLLYQAVTQHDIPLVQSLVFLFIAAALLLQTLTGVVRTWLDPRLSQSVMDT